MALGQFFNILLPETGSPCAVWRLARKDLLGARTTQLRLGLATGIFPTLRLTNLDQGSVQLSPQP
jgi:hypothetical protein